MRAKLLTASMTAFVAAIATSGVAAAQCLPAIQERGELLVAVGLMGTKPYVWKNDQTGLYEGYEPELLEELTTRIGIDGWDYAITEWTTMIPGLKAERWDAIFSGMSVTQERVQGAGIEFSDPYFMLYDHVIVLEDSPITTMDDLKDKTVASVPERNPVSERPDVTQSALSVALSELTEAQAVAADWRDGPMFVLAGPGSGKTRVLTTRVAKLLADTPDRSFRVLALTFTNKAADEMSGRVTALVPEQERRAVIGTFHSFCMQMLQQHGSHIGINPDFAIYSLDVDRQEILRDAIKQAGLGADDLRLLSTIDKLKSRLIQPEGSARYFRDPSDGARVERLYAAYETALAQANALDFGSLIAQAHRLVTSFAGIAGRYRRTYAYWMFDEFQDTTDGQYRLIRALAGEDFNNVFAVADDDQIIYQWNGASYQQIQRFRADFSPQELQLPTNYRCPPAIVAAANHLVVHNLQRTTAKRPLEAGKTSLRYPDDQHIRVMRYSSDEVEAASIADGISRIDRSRWGEVAVIARTRSLLEKLQAALVQKQVAAVISQRRDDFRSPQFLWMAAVLRQALRPLDRRALEILTGAFNRWFGTDTRVDLIITTSELTERSFLDEWAVAVKSAAVDIPDANELAVLAAKCGKEPTRFRAFIEAVLAKLPTQDDGSSDIAEDRAAWSDLTRNIGKTIGRDAPLEQFLQELAIRSKEAPVGGNTVTLMTIHGAKGKEFDHVYVVGLAEDVLPSFQSLKAGEKSPEMEEERRNCFVAITRAREWLCLSYADSYRGWAKQPSRFLKEMGFGLPDRPAQ